MEFTSDHNQIPNQAQVVSSALVTIAGVDRRTAFRMWQLTGEGKSLEELGKSLDMSASAISSALNGERMPVKNHNALLAAGVPGYLLPRAEDVKPGPKPK